MKRTISIIGAGRVGKTLGESLRKQGWQIGAVVTRSVATSRAAVRAIGVGTAHGRVTRQALDADVVLIATPDSAIESVAQIFANFGREACSGKIFLHTSGALGRSVLAPLVRLQAATGSLHPMQTFTGRGLPKLEGAIFAVEGDKRALRAAQGIARTLGGVPITINGKGKPAYHAAGALAAGHALALVESATQILMGLGFPRRRAQQTLLPLMRQMLDNFERLGPHASWTGPIARGDYVVVAKHMQALRSYPIEFGEAYAALARLAGRVLSKHPGATLRRLERALKNPRGGKS
jgi:predicted short-subunit dehydrogenase-like oxidoreductase (DUF2520 family)